MASAVENYKIALNVLARVGVDGDFVGEYSKAMAMLHGMDTYNQLQPPPITPQPTISGQPDQSTAQPQNTPIMPQNEGQGAMNLP